MPKFKSEKYLSLQVGAGNESVRFVNGHVEVSEEKAKELRKLPEEYRVVELPSPRPKKRAERPE